VAETPARAPNRAGREVDEATLPLVAFQLGRPRARIVPASHERSWMSEDMSRGPYRCLPLSIANSSGWMLLNEQAFSASWDGGASAASTRLVFASRRGSEGYHATSAFGHGIITFLVPFLFRTPPGFNLLARGPANMPKDGVAPLEGIVETDWAVATFTMNWQLTRRDTPVVFEEDEPVCMLVPQRRGELAQFHPELRSLEPESPLGRDHAAWHSSRMAFLHERNRALSVPRERSASWQRHYFRGVTVGGDSAPQHETKVRLRPFQPPAPSDDHT
jgi:Family of unknown function (DUF6065)